MNEQEKMLLGAGVAIALYLLLFRKSAAVSLSTPFSLTTPYKVANMTPAPANTPSNSASNLASKVSDWAYQDTGGAQSAVTDVERPIFQAAGLGSNPTLQEQMAYYYKDGM